MHADAKLATLSSVINWYLGVSFRPVCDTIAFKEHAVRHVDTHINAHHFWYAVYHKRGFSSSLNGQTNTC